MSSPMMLGDVAAKLGVELWQVRRLYQRGLLPEPQRMGNFRVVFVKDLPAIAQSLREAGYLKDEPAEESGA
jgi:hypothetical protein